MTDEGVAIILALEPRREVSEEEAGELAEFFCGKEEEDGKAE